MTIDLNTEFVIVWNLLHSKLYIKSVFPYLKYNFFQLPEYQKIVKVIKNFYTKYEKIVPYSSLVIFFKEKDKTISEDELKIVLETLQAINEYKFEEEYSLEFNLSLTEEYFKKRALFNALVEAESIFETRPNSINSIPDLIQEALQLCFNKSIGHEYLADADQALEYYHNVQMKYPTHLEKLNEATGGGLARGKLHVFLGQPGGGKSRMLVDLCSHYMKQGLNCLFISMELDIMDIRQRFDANIMDIDINDFPKIEKEKFISKVNQIKMKSYGRLIIQHYPGGSVNCNHFKNLIEELKNKKNFVPDVIAIDYIMLVNPAKNVGEKSYEQGKQISMEMRSLFDINNAIGLAPNQLNRGGWNTSDVMMKDIADSAGIMHNADFVAGITGPDELLNENKILMVILKNRLFSLCKNKKLMLGYDDTRMRHFNVAQGDLVTGIEKPKETVFDKDKFKNWDFTNSGKK
jgi:archaellum biogenesis ATPase FlaH